MSGVVWPAGWRVELLTRVHKRRAFRSGETAVDSWLRDKALQSQAKNLTASKVLLSEHAAIVAYYTLATSQIDFADLPLEITKKLPKRFLPIAVIAWLGVASSHQGQGLGTRILAQALCNCYEASQTFPFVAVVLDCLNNQAKSFYEHFDFEEVPGHSMKLFLSFKKLEKMMNH